jgi:metallo-beta-lactamase family protein
MTQASSELAEIVLHDAVKIMSYETANNPPLYSLTNVNQILSQIRIVRYEQPILVGPYTITYTDAGHILGSASILIEDQHGEKVLFSGDLGNSPQDIIKPTKTPPTADIVVMESTYGGRLHQEENAMALLAKEFRAIEKNQGTLLIPAFSIERTQELLHRINHLKSESAIDENTQVFVDSPMAINVTKVFSIHKELYNQELKDHARYEDPFSFPSLQLCYRAKDREKIWSEKGAKAIIAGSGMMTGGRIVSHAKKYLSSIQNRILFVGYQGVDTLGREILSGKSTVMIGEEEVEVRSQVSEITSLSSHADHNQLLDWIGEVNPSEKIILTHGDDLPRQELNKSISEKLSGPTVHLPQQNEVIEI